MTDRVVRGLMVLLVVLVGGCASDNSGAVTSSTPTPAPKTSVAVTASTDVGPSDSGNFPNIVAAEATLEDERGWRFDVTVSSPYDTPQRYADAWRVLGPDGTEYGIRVLTHDHASEQPFTRSQGGIEIPEGVATVTIQGRDLINGWGGGTLELDLP